MNALERAWRDDTALATLLGPLSWLYGRAIDARARGHAAARRPLVPSALPLVVVGNLSVGGTGKTPLTAHLVEALRARGRRPGIVSRGHGGARHEAPRLVRADDTADVVGDEPLMLCRVTGAPVCVCVRRPRAVALLARDTDCDIVLSDDGLQHLAMARDAEIVVVDAAYGFGNGRLLPAGPLRERPARLAGVDLVAVRRERLPAAARATPGPDGTRTHPLLGMPGMPPLDPASLPPAFEFATGEPRVRRWPDGPWRPLATFHGRRVHAVAGIARPERFFELLRRHGIDAVRHPLADHRAFRAADFVFDDAHPVLVTSKDAVRLDRAALHRAAGATEVAGAAGATGVGEAAGAAGPVGPAAIGARTGDAAPGEAPDEASAGWYEVRVDLVTDHAFETLLDALERRLRARAGEGAAAADGRARTSGRQA